jgi:hypothetical protein
MFYLKERFAFYPCLRQAGFSFRLSAFTSSETGYAVNGGVFKT